LTAGHFFYQITVQQFGRRFAGANYGLISILLAIFNVTNITILASININFQSACYVLAAVSLLGCANIIYFQKGLIQK
jgi:hypothetical protein